MVYSSMKKLLEKFPYFLKKSSDSNFYKSEYVFNEQFKEIYNDLFQVYESFHLQKRLLVWRSQTSAYDYSINFIANYPYLKSVTCYKNDEVIYSEAYTYEDNVSSFSYVYNGHSETIIPSDNFKIIVETFEEYQLVKGFPENDTLEGNIYDHDPSLDSIGLLHNIPRKTYRVIHKLTDDIYYIYKGIDEINFDEVTINDMDKDDFQSFNTNGVIEYYTQTEYPFNNEITEDDYHYMNRILNYVNYLHDYPLPVIEIWKIYGLPIEEIELINRERYLCKMFEESRHLNQDGIYDSGWKKKIWEHKDLMCGKRKEDIFFFANVNNSSPIEGQTIRFTFQFFNEYARKVDNDYFIIPFINDERYLNFYIDTSKDGFSWIINTDDLPGIEDEYSFDFSFHAYEDLDDLTALNSNYIESDTIRVTIKGCNNGDLYVDCINGNDTNPGTSLEPLRTLAQAIKKLEGYNNVIVLVNKNKPFYIDNTLKINESCSIISCPRDSVIYQNNGFEIFRIFQDNHLYLQNIILKHKCCEMYAKADDFINKNRRNYPLKVTIPDWVCKTNTRIVMLSNSYDFYAHHEYGVRGILSTEDDTRMGNATVELYDYNDNLLDTTNTSESGEYGFTNTFTAPGDYTFIVKYPETKNYCNSETSYIAHVSDMPTYLTATTNVNKIIIDGSFTVTYGLKDHFNHPITTGSLKLYEDNVLVKTISNGAALTYTPRTDGLHNYRLVYDETGYVTTEVTFKVNVVKFNTSISLRGEGKSTYLTSEPIPITAVIMDENEEVLVNARLKLYSDNTLITTLTSNSDGEVSWSNTLPAGRHTLRLEYDDTHKYYASVSNGYRVRVRETPVADINLYLYPEHKVLLSKATSIPLHVYATNSQGTPISTTFKIWDTYGNSCEINDREVYTTGNDGWWSGNLSTQAIANCEGVLVQAISTIDEDVFSNSAHIIYTAEPKLTVAGDISTQESFYSYSDDVIHVEGYLVDDEEEDPVPNEPITVKMLNGNTVVSTKSLTTDLKGEWNTTFTTNSTVRGHDLTFKVEYAGVTKKYTSFTESTIVEFKQLATSVSSNNLSLICGQKIPVTGTVIDENGRLVDYGTVTVKRGTTTGSGSAATGNFTVKINELLTASTYQISIDYVENTYYKSSSKNITATLSKATPVISVAKNHTLVRDEAYSLPYTFRMQNLDDMITATVPFTGTLKLQKTDNTILASVSPNQNITLTFQQKSTITTKLVYSGNDYLNSVTITDIILKVTDPSINITNTETGPWDINILDEFPANTSGYNQEDYLIRAEYLNDGNPKLTITDDPDYDTSGAGEDDIVLIDTDEDPELILED